MHYFLCLRFSHPSIPFLAFPFVFFLNNLSCLPSCFCILRASFLALQFSWFLSAYYDLSLPSRALQPQSLLPRRVTLHVSFSFHVYYLPTGLFFPVWLVFFSVSVPFVQPSDVAVTRNLSHFYTNFPHASITSLAPLQQSRVRSCRGRMCRAMSRVCVYP